MHNSPVATLVLASGKTRFLVYLSGINCLLTLSLIIILAPNLGLGAAVIGYFTYVLLQISGYYFYYIPYVLKLNSLKLFFNSFAPSLLIGMFGWGIVYEISTLFNFAGIRSLFVNSAVFILIYGLLIFCFVIRPKELKELQNKFFTN
jgi:O-antigen/teichoic acid export membrane protein